MSTAPNYYSISCSRKRSTMRNFIAFLNAVLIVSSVLSFICCLPTQTQPGTSDEDSSASEEHSMCFAVPEDISDDDELNKNLLATDSEGKLCPARFNPSNYPNVKNDDEFDARFANWTRDFCPTWPESKQCVLDHLNSDKCNEDDKKEASQIISLNEEIVYSELICNPPKTPHFFNVLKAIRKDKLWECFELESVNEVYDECLSRSGSTEETGDIATFQDYFHSFSCIAPGLRVCASGDLIKAEKFVQIWTEFERSFKEAYTAFWN